MGMGMTYVDTSNLAPKAVASTARRMTAYLRPYTRRLVPAAASLVIASLLNLGPPWATKIAVDDFIAQRDFGGILRIVAVLVVIYNRARRLWLPELLPVRTDLAARDLRHWA